MTETLYHGTNGDAIRKILSAGEMVPSEGRIYFAKHRWESALMHGADSQRGACFVMKLKVEIPDDAVRYHTATAGVPDTLIIATEQPLSVEVLELWVRRPTSQGFHTQHFVGTHSIRSVL